MPMVFLEPSYNISNIFIPAQWQWFLCIVKDITFCFSLVQVFTMLDALQVGSHPSPLAKAIIVSEQIMLRFLLQFPITSGKRRRSRGWLYPHYISMYNGHTCWCLSVEDNFIAHVALVIWVNMIVTGIVVNHEFWWWWHTMDGPGMCDALVVNVQQICLAPPSLYFFRLSLS